jgi:thioredoxin-related protein
MCCNNSIFSAEPKGIIDSILIAYSEQKVAEIQKVVQFTDQQAQHIVNIEYNYLLGVQKAENCSCCNTGKRIEKAAKTKDEAMKKVLPSALYIRYKAVENQQIKIRSLWAN